jgi:DNA-binding CsgD family transcriptional regulator
MSNDAIAMARRTSTHTTANQMASILSKLGLGSRFELAGLPLAPIATESAKPTATARTALQQVALAAVQHRLRDPAEDGAALRFWQGLVEGRLRLIEHFESRRLRYYVAREVTHEARSGLDARERLLAQIIGSGQSQKVAASELRVGSATASILLKSALVKLGLRTRVDLVMLVQATIVSSTATRLPRQLDDNDS